MEAAKGVVNLVNDVNLLLIGGGWRRSGSTCVTGQHAESFTGFTRFASVRLDLAASVMGGSGLFLSLLGVVSAVMRI